MRNSENGEPDKKKNKKVIIITMLVFIALMSVIITVVFMNDKTPANDTTATRKSTETIAKNDSTTNKTTKNTTEVNSKTTKKTTTSESTKSTTKNTTTDSTSTEVKTTNDTTTTENTTTDNNTTTERRTTTERQTSETTTSAPSTTEAPVPSTQKPNTTEETTTAHSHSYKVVNSKDATCTSNGSVTYKCSCGDSYTETIAATGHSWKTTHTKKTIHHDEVGHTEIHYVSDDGFDFTAAGYSRQEIIDYCREKNCGFGDIGVWIVDTPAYDEVVDIPTTTCTVCGATK